MDCDREAFRYVSSNASRYYKSGNLLPLDVCRRTKISNFAVNASLARGIILGIDDVTGRGAQHHKLNFKVGMLSLDSRRIHNFQCASLYLSYPLPFDLDA